MSYKTFSLVLPVYNQADHIAVVVREYQDALSEFRIEKEILLVPNGCRDNSLSECQRLSQESPEVLVVQTAESGWGNAICAGLRQARGDLLGYTNTARTSAEDLRTVVSFALEIPGTVVKANRKIRERFLRRLGSLLYNLECRALYDLSCWDINGTPKIFPREAIDGSELTDVGDLIDLEFCIACFRKNLPLVEVPVFSARRRSGRSTTNLLTALRLYQGAWAKRNHWIKP